MSAADPKPPRRKRYQEILTVLRRRIFAGTYPVGATLPSEAEFCREFDSSRFTVREALRRLQADGLVARQQGAGSTVIRNAARAAFVQSYGSVEELLQFARDTDYRVLDVTPATLDATLAAHLVAEPGETWTCQRGLRLEGPDSEPLAVIESYMPPDLSALIESLRVGRPPFYSALERATGRRVTDVVQEVQALPMPGPVAKALSVPKGSISLRIFRRYETEEGTLIASFNWHLGGDRFVYRTRLRQQPAPS